MWRSWRDEDYLTWAHYFGADALAGSRWQNGTMDNQTPEGYDQSESYVPCPHATLKLKTNKDGGWFVCRDCGDEFQVIPGARKAGASSI
jgi:hypothetical protein